MRHGFTTLELLVVMTIVLIVFGISFFAVTQVQRGISLETADIAVIDVLTTANRRARAGEQQSSWGVYFPYNETTRTANELLVFSGNSYATRDVAFDISYQMPETTLFDYIDLSGAGSSSGNDHEIVFSALYGATSQYGYLILKSLEATRTITVTEEGVVTREF